MSASPVFVADRATLLTQLRLPESSLSGIDPVVDLAIQRGRVEIYGRLSISRVATLQAIAYAENAATANQLLRLKANLLEVKLVRSLLMRELPMLFMDGSNQSHQAWNEDAFSRNVEASKQKAHLRALTEDIETLFTELEDNDYASSGGGVNTYVPERDDGRYVPGSAIKVYTGDEGDEA